MGRLVGRWSITYGSGYAHALDATPGASGVSSPRRRPNVIAKDRQPGVDALKWLELNNPDLFRKMSQRLSVQVSRREVTKP